MTRTDIALVAALVAVVLLAGVGGAMLGGDALGVVAALAVAAAALLAAQLASHRVLKDRVRRVEDRAAGTETLVGLYRALPVRAPLPATDAWSATPDFLALVAETVAERRPALVVECGSGTSTVVAAYALEANGGGRVVSLDHEAPFAERTRGLLRRHGLVERGEVRHAPLAPVPDAAPGGAGRWYDGAAWADLDGIDVLVVDGPPTGDDPGARGPALRLLWDRLAPGAVVLVDDAARPGERAVVAAWAGRFPDLDVAYLPLQKGAYVLRKPA